MARNKYPEVTIDRILEASKRLFLEKGYDNTTIQDIVNELDGLTKGAVYYHFKSKEEIMNALEDKMFFDNNPFEMVHAHTELNALEKLRMLVKLNKNDEDQIELMKQSIPLMKNPQILARTLDSNYRILYPYCLALFEEGKKDGSIPVENPQVLAEFMVLVNMWFLPSLFPGENETVRQRYLFVTNIFESFGISFWDKDMEDIISDSSYFSEPE